MAQQKPYEVQQRRMSNLGPHTEQPPESVQAGNRLASDIFAEKELRVLVNDSLKFSQQCDFQQ